MLSHLKSYLFGGAVTDGGSMAAVMAPTAQQADASFIINSISGRAAEDEDWVLVDSQDVSDDSSDGPEVTRADLEESWIVTQDGLGTGQCSKNRRGHHHRNQPKGTKPRRWRNGKKNNNSSSSSSSQAGSNCTGRVRSEFLEDAESTTSSIAIVPSPEPRQLARPTSAPAAAAAVLAASTDAKQVAAISAARTAKAKVDKNWMSRKNLMRGNQTATAASAGRNHRRSHLMVSRLCGSNNNRKSHQY